MITERIEFSYWNKDDGELANSLWGDPEVTRFICANGVFTEDAVQNRLQFEIACQEKYGVQYWPMFHKETGELIGCCGLHPHGDGCYELGFHLRPEYWHQGYAKEAARAVIEYAFDTLGASELFAGHNPKNEASRAVLTGLGFVYTGDEFYPPTGLNHPSYSLKNESARLLTDLLPRNKHDDSTIKDLIALSDEDIAPLMPELLTWLQDPNWPIFGKVADVVVKHAAVAGPYILEVLRGTDEAWKYNILTWLMPQWDNMPGHDLISEISRIAEHPTEQEIHEEVHDAAVALIEKFAAGGE